jgi:hypothetical protein
MQSRDVKIGVYVAFREETNTTVEQIDSLWISLRSSGRRTATTIIAIKGKRDKTSLNIASENRLAINDLRHSAINKKKKKKNDDMSS